MKSILVLLIVLGCSASVIAQQSPSEVLADKIAVKMKDSLSLNTAQKNQVYQVNVQITQQKLLLRNSYAVGSDSLRIKTQRVENTRDSLYGIILTNEQRLLYLQKKRNLINSN